MNTAVLLDKKTLMEKHPALNSKWRLEWLIRTRQIPVVRIGHKIYFENNEIEAWIGKNKIKEIG